ncbi:hypothetical protein ABZ771_34605, partial [Streptomyces globisporus]
QGPRQSSFLLVRGTFRLPDHPSDRPLYESARLVLRVAEPVGGLHDQVPHHRELREEDAQARVDREVARIAAELQDRPDFRAATKRSHHRDIAHTAYPPPADADDEGLREHQRIVSWATTQATETVEREARRIYAAHERALHALAEEITRLDILAGATTVAARTLLLQDFLAGKSDGYAAPKRTIELLLTKPQLQRPKKADHSKTTDQLQLI